MEGNLNKSPETKSQPTELDESRKTISVLIDEITATTLELLQKGVDPGHAVDKREAIMIVNGIIEKAYST